MAPGRGRGPRGGRGDLHAVGVPEDLPGAGDRAPSRRARHRAARGGCGRSGDRGHAGPGPLPEGRARPHQPLDRGRRRVGERRGAGSGRAPGRPPARRPGGLRAASGARRPRGAPTVIETPSVELAPIAPELILVGTAIVALLGGVVLRSVGRLVWLFASLAGVAGAAAAAIMLWDWEGASTVLAGSVAVDRFGVVVRLIVLGVTAIGLLFGHHYLERSGEARTEFYPLMLFAAAGMTLFSVSADLIVAFLALEILSLSLYVLTGFSQRLGSVEGAMKYFLLGAFSSAFFLFGVAMAYGATASTSLVAISNALAGETGSVALALTSVGLLAVGVSFKVSAVPFHIWTPDVYQGAPTAITAFMSAGTKVAAFAAFMRIFNVAFQPLAWDWQPVVWALAAISVIVGSVLAIAQTDIKRMLAYSSISHAGFVLMGLTAAGEV